MCYPGTRAPPGGPINNRAAAMWSVGGSRLYAIINIVVLRGAADPGYRVRAAIVAKNRTQVYARPRSRTPVRFVQNTLSR